MSLAPHTRVTTSADRAVRIRPGAAAAAFGALMGLAIGCAYLGGTAAKATTVRAQAERIEGATAAGFTEEALAGTGHLPNPFTHPPHPFTHSNHDHDSDVSVFHPFDSARPSHAQTWHPSYIHLIPYIRPPTLLRIIIEGWLGNLK